MTEKHNSVPRGRHVSSLCQPETRPSGRTQPIELTSQFTLATFALARPAGDETAQHDFLRRASARRMRKCEGSA